MTLLPGSTAPVMAQPTVEVLHSSGRRPLADVIEQLESRFGVAITYEDPQWDFDGDLVDVTATTRRDALRDAAHRVIVPAGVPFSFEIPQQPRTVPTALPLLQELLRQYENSGNNGRFVVSTTGALYHVSPTARRDAHGSLAPMTSRLGIDVRLTSRPADALQLIQQVVGAVSSAGPPMFLATVPTNLLKRTAVTDIPADGKAADLISEAIAQALAQTGVPVSWQLFCDRRQCALNLHMVTKG